MSAALQLEIKSDRHLPQGHIQEFTNERINYTSLEILFDLWINILKGFQGILTQSLVYGTHYVIYSSF